MVRVLGLSRLPLLPESCRQVGGVFTIGLIILLIYKSTLTMRRDDQLFLDDASSHMHEEQTELLAMVNRLTIPMRVFSIGSGVNFW
jgi:hypothetical protein